jgi:hypothetical protein
VSGLRGARLPYNDRDARGMPRVREKLVFAADDR